jgi:hypothetical protein
MLTRVLFAVLVLGAALAGIALMPAGVASAKSSIAADAPKLLAIGITTGRVTADELAKGGALPKPKFDTPAVGYAMVGNLKQGDVVWLSFASDKGGDILHSQETEQADKARTVLMAGRLGVPGGGWDPVKYYVWVTVTRDGKVVLDDKTTPIKFP